MSRIVVMGDVGGHAEQLRAALAGCGITDRIPAGTTVVQVGDLVDRGPQSAEVLGLVDSYLGTQPQRWVQLAGNHEAQYLHHRQQFWGEQLGEGEAQLLRRWWHTHRMRVAAAIRTRDGEEYLITHAGLTPHCWRELDEPMTAATAAMRLNERPELIWRGPLSDPELPAGPLWAEAGWELHEPWMQFHSGGGFVAFGQIHGHSTIVRYATQTWTAPEKVRQRATVDWAARHVRVRIGGRQFIGIDPKHGTAGAPRWQPLVLDEAEVIEAALL